MQCDEVIRQCTLDTYRFVDGLRRGAYDYNVKLAAILCDAPAALVTPLVRDRQLFKSRLGFDPLEDQVIVA